MKYFRAMEESIRNEMLIGYHFSNEKKFDI